MSKSDKVSRKTIEKFKQRGGYKIARAVFADDGVTVIGTKGLREAARETKMSKTTIRKILYQAPHEEIKAEFGYMKEWKSSEFYKDFRRELGGKKHWGTISSHVRTAWKLFRTHPCSWDKAEYGKLWGRDPDFDSPFFNPALGDKGGVAQGYATSLHHLMVFCDKDKLVKTFKGFTPERGKKKTWYFNEEDIRKMLPKLEDNETLVCMFLGIVEGARISSLIRQHPVDINQKRGEIECVEPKRRGRAGGQVVRTIPQCVLDLVNRYIQDYDIEPTEPLFRSEDFIREEMKKAAERAGVVKKFPITTHILKHTFVTQAANRGMPEAEIEKQTGTEARTLVAHYQADDPRRTRHYLRGEESPVAPFIEWVRSLNPVFVTEYERIQREGVKVDDYRGRL